MYTMVQHEAGRIPPGPSSTPSACGAPAPVPCGQSMGQQPEATSGPDSPHGLSSVCAAGMDCSRGSGDGSSNLLPEATQPGRDLWPVIAPLGLSLHLPRVYS